jgi:protein dithiol oxidoreductase (disulfide-forming)
MSIRKRTGSPPLAALAALLALLPAAGAAQLVEGTDYRTLAPPRPTSSPGKIEVLEFFSYACPHCNKFYPLVSAWVAKLPKDVVFKRVPVGYGRPEWLNLSRAFYALQATGDLGKLDGPLFHAIHEEQQPLFEEQAIADWVGKHGGNADKFANAYVSFGVNNQTVQADQMVEDYQIGGVPALAVNGRYVVISPGEASDEEKTFRELLDRTDKVIVMARAAGTAHAAAPKAAAAKPAKSK